MIELNDKQSSCNFSKYRILSRHDTGQGNSSFSEGLLFQKSLLRMDKKMEPAAT